MDKLLIPLLENESEIFFVSGQRGGRYPYSHSMLISDCLMDTGISSGYLRKLKRKKSISTVLLSHWHEDHTSGNRLLKNCEFYAHHDDREVIENPELIYKYYSLNKQPETDLMKSILEGLRISPTEISKFLREGQTIEREGYEINVVHTPGHTKGHCCFFERVTRSAFLADIDLSSFGPWYGAIDSNLVDFVESIEKVMKLDIEQCVTSHKGIIRGRKLIKEKLLQYKSVISKRDEKVLSLLSERKPKTLKDLEGKNIIYEPYSEYEIYERIAERVMIQNHLEKLQLDGIISEEKEGIVLA